MPKKPTGVSGITKLTTGELPEFLPVPLPGEKAEIEAHIFRNTIASLRGNQLDVYHLQGSPKQLAQNNFDFELATANGTEYLDLVEFAPLERHAGSYDRVPNKHVVGEFADQVWDVVKKKSKKYGVGRRGRIHLLIYTTDWRVLFSDSVVALLTLWCARRSHGFRSVVYFAPIDQNVGWARVLHPGVIPPSLLSASDERRMRHREYTNFDPRGMKPTADGRGFTYEL